ncbi:hypothetical protein [Erythrobacter sp. WG]|nr:hypothetical protein [Erythrobacter sp. WG]MCX9146583.1 hypothetical protein [Erythrobacter sp. WG]
MKPRLPTEEAIAREMREAGLDRFPAIRRIQQREQLRAQLGQRTRGAVR